MPVIGFASLPALSIRPWYRQIIFKTKAIVLTLEGKFVCLQKDLTRFGVGR
jgi:hypothetical protein